MAEPKDELGQPVENAGPAREVPQETTPAQEWGERDEHARTIASGGKDSEKAPADSPQRPK